MLKKAILILLISLLGGGVVSAGHVNRTTLQSYYQQPGDVYDDTKTEGAFETVAQQVDDNYDVTAAISERVSSLVGSGEFAATGFISIKSQPYSAAGDGVTDDTVSFELLETSVNGRMVDLAGGTYVVESIPTKNIYFNGTFKVNGYTRPARMFDSVESGVAKRHLFGGQLAKLKHSLSNPLEQITSIVFIGDSITWGTGLGTENAVSTPRDGTLSDPRDNFESPSYVNTIKRYIGEMYAFDSEPALSNWAAAPSGESIAEYSVQNVLYPRYGDFEISTTGVSMTVAEVSGVTTSATGYQLRLEDGNTSGTGYHSLKFPFTGDSFTIAFGCNDVDATYYDLIVDGVNKGTFGTSSASGFVNGTSDNRRTHTFDYVRNKTVEIRTNRNGAPTGVKRLRVEAIITDKKIRLSNQGINGTTVARYMLYNMPGNTFGDGEAIEEQDNYVFVQLGTNDRVIRSDTPKGSNQFRYQLQNMVDAITPLAELVLMVSNPAKNEDPATYSFNMQQVRDVIYRTAKHNEVDMIDNYAIFRGIDLDAVTSDGLHPNNLGMYLIARNIINSLESAE